MKKLFVLLSVALSIITIGSTFTVSASETTRPSISISAPSERLVKGEGTVRYTIELSDAHGEEVTFNSAALIESFAYDNRYIVKISKNIYDVVYSGIKGDGSNYIKIKKGGGIVRELETIETPNSQSFFVYYNSTKREIVADYLLHILGDNNADASQDSVFTDAPAKYNTLYYQSLMVGNGEGKLNLRKELEDEEAYIINRRIALSK